jgi:hypothetical protein
MVDYEKYIKYKEVMICIELEEAPNDHETDLKSEIKPPENKPKPKPKPRMLVSHLKREKIKGRLEDWSKSLTAHGFSNIFLAKRKPIKILWILSLMSSIMYCIYNIYSEIRGYLKYDHSTHLETVVEMPTLFPTISICNINPFITKKSENLIREIFNLEYGINLTNYSLTPIELIEKLNYVNLKAKLNAYLPEYKDEHRKELGFSLEDILIECNYNHNACTHSDFVWFYSLNYGNCYRFNSGFNKIGDKQPIKRSVRPGSENGLSLVFFLGESENRFSSAWSTGLKIFVHNNTARPSIYDGIEVKMATSTNIGVKRTFQLKLPKPYSECIDLDDYEGSVIFESMKNSSYKYRQKDCFDLCLQKDIINVCKCYDLNYERLDNVSACVNSSQLTCANEEYLKYTKDNMNKKCTMHCPLECDEITYDYTLSSSDYPTEHVYDILKGDIHVSRVSNLTYSKFKERSLMVNIFYSQLNYLAITQVKKFQFMDLLASIGGLLGFFVGMSLLSFIELAEILMEIIMIII